MINVDLLINGNLLIINELIGGGAIWASSSIEEVHEYFNVDNAIYIEGDITISSLDCNDKTIVVIGEVAEGGCDECI